MRVSESTRLQLSQLVIDPDQKISLVNPLLTFKDQLVLSPNQQKSKIKLTKQKLTVANLSYMHNFEFVDAMLALTTVSTSSLPAPQQLDLDLTQLVI